LGSSKASRHARNSGKKSESNGKSAVSRILTPQIKGIRLLQSEEVYSKLFFDERIKPHVDAEMKRLTHEVAMGGSADHNGDADAETINDTEKKLPTRIAIVKKVAREQFAAETPEIKAQVEAHVEQLKSQKKEQIIANKSGDNINQQA
jgi:hypothetical protein